MLYKCSFVTVYRSFFLLLCNLFITSLTLLEHYTLKHLNCVLNRKKTKFCTENLSIESRKNFIYKKIQRFKWHTGQSNLEHVILIDSIRCTLSLFLN